jgi:arylsulfatase A-like enzyme
MSGRVNVMLIICDQLSAHVLGCYGGSVPTPYIDRLARSGMVFTDATCPWPVCTPSRASVVTGLYPHTHGICHNMHRVETPGYFGNAMHPSQEGLHPTDVTTEGLLKATGYQTYHYGKWHLTDEPSQVYADMFLEHLQYGDSLARVFAQVRERPRDMWMDWYGWSLPVHVAPAVRDAVACVGSGWDDHKHAELVRKIGRLELPLEQTFDYQVASRTCDRLAGLGPEPFMITCSFLWPHDPNVVPSPYYDFFDPDRLELPGNWDHRGQRFENQWSRRIVRDFGEGATREFLRIYYACVALIDEQVGRVLQALQATGRDKDTLVIFTSDHGDMVGGHGMVWKSTDSFYDEVARVPLIMSFPGQIQPGRSAIAANLVDLMPTILDFVANAVPPEAQGHSLVPFLRGEQSDKHAPRYSFSERVQQHPTQAREVTTDTTAAFMVRGEGRKYFVYPDGEEFLFNLVADPGETQNLAADPSQHELLTILRSELHLWMDATDYSGRRPPIG